MFLKNKKTFLLLIGIVLFIAILTACGSSTTNNQDELEMNKHIEENPIVTITMEDDAKVLVELYPQIAPNTVNNFVSLIEDGFYDGLIFHRVIPGFMIQGGDPDGTGGGGPGHSIKGEFSSNGFENDLKHDRGVISMARTPQPDSAGSQFFIMAAESSSLDGDYASFGKVIEGMEVVDAIVTTERDGNDKPLEDQQIKTIKIDKKGYDYPKPVIIE